MKKNSQKKLSIYRETLRRVDMHELDKAEGARAACTSTAGPPCEDK